MRVLKDLGYVIIDGRKKEVVAIYENHYLLEDETRIHRKSAEIEPGVKCKIYHVNFKEKRLFMIERIPADKAA